jgi:hypothetical protein
MWVRILERPKLAKGLKAVSDVSRKLINHNLNFPEDSSNFQEWQKDLGSILLQIYQKLGLFQ